MCRAAIEEYMFVIFYRKRGLASPEMEMASGGDSDAAGSGDVGVPSQWKEVHGEEGASQSSADEFSASFSSGGDGGRPPEFVWRS
jgi:hypothetical protein